MNDFTVILHMWCPLPIMYYFMWEHKAKCISQENLNNIYQNYKYSVIKWDSKLYPANLNLDFRLKSLLTQPR